MKKPSIKLQLFLFLCAFALFLLFKDKNGDFLLKSVIAVTACGLIEALFSFFKNKEFKITESSLVTGVLIGFVLSSRSAGWIFMVAGALAIASKYLIRFKGRHIFNPAALGAFLATVFFKQGTQWHGAYTWYIIIPAGLYFAWRIKKIPVVCGYFFAYLIAYAIVSRGVMPEFLNQVYYANYFFIFIMLIEPKTSPFDFKEGIIFGIFTAVASFILYRVNFAYDADLPGLLMGNLLWGAWGAIKK